MIEALIRFELESRAILNYFDNTDVLANCYTSLYNAILKIREHVAYGIMNNLVTESGYKKHIELINIARSCAKYWTLKDEVAEEYEIKLEAFIECGKKLKDFLADNGYNNTLAE